MIASKQNSDVVWIPPGADVAGYECIGGWYFFLKDGKLGGGPYGTERKAIAAIAYFAEKHGGERTKLAGEGDGVRNRAPAVRKKRRG
jgi:hypothetical protein